MNEDPTEYNKKKTKKKSIPGKKEPLYIQYTQQVETTWGRLVELAKEKLSEKRNGERV